MRWFRSNKGGSVNGSPKLHDLPEIVASNISSVGVINGPQFVFLLTMNSGEQVVLKAEMNIASPDKTRSHDLGLRIMGMVSAVKAQALTPAEEVQIGRLSTGITIDFFRAETQIQAGQAKWVKAAYQKNLDGLSSKKDFTAQDGTVNKAKQIKLKGEMAKLKVMLEGNTKAWKSLGKIVAVDYLLGNQDRIDILNGQIVNWGNIQFRIVNGKIVKAIGLDSMDGAPTSQINSLYETADNDGAMYEWRRDYGTFLKDPQTALPKMKNMMVYANKEMLLNFGEQGSWGDTEAKALHGGFVDGIKTIKPQMKSLVKKMSISGTKPTILLKRLEWLGWA